MGLIRTLKPVVLSKKQIRINEMKKEHKKTRRVISLFLVIISASFCLVPSTYADSKSDHCVYVFPVTEKSEEWMTYSSVQQMIDVYQVPENVLKSMTSESLVYTILENSFLTQYIAYDNGIIAFDAHMKSFNIYRELFSRDDCAEAISDVYSECTIDRDENMMTPFYLEEMVAYMIYKDYDLSKVEKRINDKYNEINAYRKANPDVFNQYNDGFFVFANHSDFNYGQKGQILPYNVPYTPNGTPVLNSDEVLFEFSEILLFQWR